MIHSLWLQCFFLWHGPFVGGVTSLPDASIKSLAVIPKGAADASGMNNTGDNMI